ncbi:MAG TPA: hypothetical protein VIC05_11270 [Solirubrobacteraceae bacterium]
MVAALTLAWISPAVAHATQIVSITTGFSPERLGAPTTVSLGFDVRTPDGSLPSALTGIDFHYPADLGLGTSDLGLATCNPAKAGYYGPSVCPANSIMGSGSALAKFQVSPEVSEESAKIVIVAGPSQHGYMNLLVTATGAYPVKAHILMTTLLEPGRLHFNVPLVSGIPEGPDVAVVRVRIKIGGKLTYYERRHGKRIAFHPQGIKLPRRCPRGGFRFNATFSFLDGSSVAAHTVVKCPRPRK